MVLAISHAILVEAHVEHPVPAVFDAPVRGRPPRRRWRPAPPRTGNCALQRHCRGPHVHTQAHGAAAQGRRSRAIPPVRRDGPRGRGRRKPGGVRPSIREGGEARIGHAFGSPLSSQREASLLINAPITSKTSRASWGYISDPGALWRSAKCSSWRQARHGCPRRSDRLHPRGRPF